MQRFSGGETGDDAERRRRREASKALLAQFDRTVKPVKDLLAALRDKTPPDYGPLQVNLNRTLDIVVSILTAPSSR